MAPTPHSEDRRILKHVLQIIYTLSISDFLEQCTLKQYKQIYRHKGTDSARTPKL